MRRLIVISLGLLLALTACGGNKSSKKPTASPTAELVQPSATPTPSPTPIVVPQTDENPQTQALLRIVQASPDLPPVDIYLDAAVIGTRFTRGLYHLEPLAFSAGDYLLRIVPAGADINAVTPILDYPLKLVAGQSTIVLLMDLADSLRAVTYQEDLSPLPIGMARLNVINAVLRGPIVNVQESGQALIQELDFGISGGPLEVAAGQHHYTLVSGSTLLSKLDLNLTEQFVYTAVLTGDQGGGNYQVITFHSPVATETQVRAIQASPDAPLVNVYLDDTLLAQSLDYQQSTEWTAYPSRFYNLRVAPADDPADLLYQGTVPLAPNHAVDIVLLDTVERLAAIPVEEDLSATPSNATRLVFVNAAVGVSQITVNTVGGPVSDLQAIPFEADSSLLYRVGAAELRFYAPTDDPQNPRLVDQIPQRNWAAGTVYLVVVTGYPNRPPVVLETAVGTGAVVAIEGDNGLEIQPTEEVQTFKLRLINALEDGKPVDLEIGSQSIFTGVEFGTSTDYTTLPLAAESLTFRDTITGAVLLSYDYNWTADTKLTLFLYGTQAAPQVQPALDPPIEGATLRAFHTASAFPRLKIARNNPPVSTPMPVPTEEEAAAPTEEPTPVPIVTPIVLFTNQVPLISVVELEVPTDPTLIQPDTYDVLIFDAESQKLLLTLPEVTFRQRGSYELLVLPDAAGTGIRAVLIEHVRQ